MSIATSVEIEQRELLLHGHRVSYLAAGEGPVVVFVHGLTNSSANWAPVAELLAEDHTVIAPDLLGHGASAKPQGDYSPGAYACVVRDILLALGHDSATVVGHSLGGGVAMQLAYQSPERVERLVLVGSGGLGREISALLRAASLPGAELTLPLIASSPLIDAGAAVGRFLDTIGLKVGADVAEMARGVATLNDRDARQAFLHTVRGAIEPRGQRIDATDRLYLAQAVPTLIVWGERDHIIPIEHGRNAHELMPGSRLEVFENAGHFPHVDNPIAFARTLAEFIADTEPAEVDLDELRQLVLDHAAEQNGAAATVPREPPQRTEG